MPDKKSNDIYGNSEFEAESSLMKRKKGDLVRYLKKNYALEKKAVVNELLRVMAVLIFASVLIYCIIILLKFWGIKTGDVSWAQAVEAILPIGFAFLAYRQWIAARHEISIDKYYDRIDAANKKLENLNSSEEWKQEMHVYTELDKLEYVIIKYQLGYMLPYLALRAIINFEGFCRDKKFNHRAFTQSNKASYLFKTRQIVGKVCKNCITLE